MLAEAGCGAVAADRTHDAAADAPLRHDAGAARDATAHDGRSTDARPPSDAPPDGAFTGCDAGQPGVQCVANAPAQALTVDDENIYLSVGYSTVVRVPRSGGVPATLAQSFTRVLTTDGSYVYWIDIYGDAGSEQSSIVRVPVEGGAVSTVAHLGPHADPRCLAVDDTSVYWTDNRLPDASSLQGVLKVAKAGGAPVTVAIDGPSVVEALSVDSTSVYWMAAEGIRRVSKDGGTVTTLASYADAGVYVGNCRSLALAGSTLLAAFAPGIPLSTGENQLIVVSVADAASSILATEGGPVGVVANPHTVYWSGFGTDGIHATPLDGGPTVTLARPGGVSDLVLASDGTLYWTTGLQVQALKPPE
jgi:sugar lactone lactonase YvrE